MVFSSLFSPILQSFVFKGPPALLPEPFCFITVRRAEEHMVCTDTLSLSPPRTPSPSSDTDRVTAAAVADPIILKTLI